MEDYKVTLSEQERGELQAIAGKGTHAASKVINALILLNCDQSGERTERARTSDVAAMLCVSERKVYRVKKTFVLEGLTLNRQPAQCEYDLKIDGRLLAELELVDSVLCETMRRTLKKKRTQALEDDRLGDCPQASAAFVAAMEKVLDIYSRPY